MRDFVNLLDIQDVLISNAKEVENYSYTIDYDAFDKKLTSVKKISKDFLINALKK